MHICIVQRIYTVNDIKHLYSGSEKDNRKKCAHISTGKQVTGTQVTGAQVTGALVTGAQVTGTQVTDVHMGVSIVHQMGFIVSINRLRTREEIGTHLLCMISNIELHVHTYVHIRTYFVLIVQSRRQLSYRIRFNFCRVKLSQIESFCAFRVFIFALCDVTADPLPVWSKFSQDETFVDGY